MKENAVNVYILSVSVLQYIQYNVLLCSRNAQIVIATSSFCEDTTFLSIETLRDIQRCLQPLLAE